MPLVTAAVLLCDTQLRSTVDPPKRSRLWYRDYFFHPFHGQSGYWITQTDGERVLGGEVFDWLVPEGPLPDFLARRATVEWGIRAFEKSRGVDFSSFDIIVVVVGLASSVVLNDAATGAKSKSRMHNAVLMRAGRSFDFVAHELGHAMGLSHSFGTNPIQVMGDAPGGYGHPFCIMSAMVYGGKAAAYAPATPRDDAPEFSGLGPSLNGLTARANGWIDAHVIDLSQSAQADFTIRARQWLGRTPHAPPQAVEILMPDGSNFVVDFYVPGGGDRAQPGPALVLTQGRKGRAEMHYPAANSGTYLSHIRLPVALGTPGATLRGPGFVVYALSYNAATREVRVRVRRGVATRREVVIDSRVRKLSSRVEGTDVTTWEPGEALCLTGTWSYTKMAYKEQATIDATYEFGAPGMLAQWTVEEVELLPTATPVSDTLNLTHTIAVADPRLQSTHVTRLISLEYDIEPLPNGSRLRLRNLPEDESFKLRVEVRLSNAAVTGSALTWVTFKGREYVYEPEFYRQRDACFQRFIDVGERYLPTRVVPFPQLWDRIDPLQHDRLTKWLNALAHHWERGEVELYEQGATALAHELGVPDLGLRIVSADETYSPPRIEREVAPPAPRELAAAITARDDGSSHRRRLAAYVLAGAAGAALAILWNRERT
jgi:hypothetical protein